ncbi:hypothetical protein Tco_1492325 [Tanacetum coccineum]
MSMTIQSSVKDKILATSSETSKVENAPAEILRDLDQQMEKRADDGKANVVTVALSRKERVKPRRVRAMAMTIQYGVRGMILTAQSEAFKQKNVPLVGSEMDEAHASSYTRRFQDVKLAKIYIDEIISKEWNSGDDQLRLRCMIYLMVLADAAESVRDTIGFEYYLASSNGWTKSPVLWAKIREISLTGPELVLDTTDKVVLIKEKLKAARDRQKSYVDNRRKPLKFEADASLHVPLDEIKVDKTLCFVEEPVKNSDREVKRLKCSRMVVVKFLFDELRDLVVNDAVTQLKAKLLAVRYLVKVSWNSKVGNQSIERDRLIGIGLVMDLVKFLSFTFGGKEMTFVVLAFLR